MTATITEFEQQWRTWRTERDQWARQPLGWLSLTGLYWLGEDAETVDGLPGTWRADAENVYATIESGDGDQNGSAAAEPGSGARNGSAAASSGASTVAAEVVTQDGEALSGTVTLTPAEGAPGIELRVGDRLIEVIRRSGRAALRIHDPAAPTLAAFSEIPAYEPDPAWTVTGVYSPFEVARVVTTGAVVDGLWHHHSAAGTVTFTRDGAEHTLLVFGSHLLGQHILFTDATSGDTTYGGARRLDLSRPAADGTVVLDFNRALNLPCAFTDYATCPVAPPENRLPFAVAAGEKDPRKEHTA